MIHKLTAMSKPTPLLLKARDSSEIIPAYPNPNSNTIARSGNKKHITLDDLQYYSPKMTYNIFLQGLQHAPDDAANTI